MVQAFNRQEIKGLNTRNRLMINKVSNNPHGRYYKPRH